jgi:hypothetical protein
MGYRKSKASVHEPAPGPVVLYVTVTVLKVTVIVGYGVTSDDYRVPGGYGIGA